MSIARVDIIGVPMDLGADRRGVDMGPYAIRYAKLQEGLHALGIATNDLGNINVPVAEATEQHVPGTKYLPVIEAACRDLARTVEGIVRSGGFPIILGGDHSIAMGTLAGLHAARGKAPGVIWIDAHGDINTPATSPSGNVHGMPVTFAIEAGHVNPQRLVYIGLRDLDSGERMRIRELGIRAFTMTDVDRVGMERAIEEAIAIAGSDDRSLHVSLDMDGIDPEEAPGVGTPVRGGLSYREAHLAMEEIARSGMLGSIEVTEINPILDRENKTALLAVELILSALGKSIL